MFDNPELFKKYGRNYDVDEVVFCEYEKGNEMYYVVSGKVSVSKITKNAEKVLVYLGEGEFIGEMAVFENKPRTATITAIEATKMLVFKKSDFFQLMKVAPSLVVQLIKVLSKRYLNTESQLNSLLDDNVEKRVINYIYEEYSDAKAKGAVKRLVIKIDELGSVINAEKQDIISNMLSYQKKGYLKINPTSIILHEFGWLEKMFM